MKLFAVLAVLSILAAPAAAQTPNTTDTEAPRTSLLREAIQAAGDAQPPAAAPRRDSVLNGAVIGAVAGGAALAVIGGVICNRCTRRAILRAGAAPWRLAPSERALARRPAPVSMR